MRALLFGGMVSAVDFASVRVAGSSPLVRRLTPQEMADPLAPWSLETRTPPPAPASPVPQDTTAAEATATPGVAPSPSTPSPSPEVSGERVLVVRCRQLLISNPEHARRLAALLRSGARLEDARRSVEGLELDERTRDYAIDDLDLDLRTWIESAADSAWSTVRSWRGRSAIVQIQSREVRGRDTLPALGEGLDAREREQLAQRLRAPIAPPAPAGLPHSPAASADFAAAAVLNRVDPRPPEDVFTGGIVTVLVEVGREGEVVDTRIQSSTNPAFEAAALVAARASTYKAAVRNGIPEPGTVTLTFQFAAPGSQLD